MKLIKITASWCMSCILMNEILKEIEEEYALNYQTEPYDFDNDAEKIAKYDVGTILPVYILVDESGKELGRSVGEKSKKELIQFFEENGAIDEK